MLGKEYKQSRLPELSIHQFRTVTHVTISRCPCPLRHVTTLVADQWSARDCAPPELNCCTLQTR